MYTTTRVVGDMKERQARHFATVLEVLQLEQFFAFIFTTLYTT